MPDIIEQPNLFPGAPSCVDLVWLRQDDNGDFVARCTKAFLALWFRAPDDMFYMGFRCRSGIIDGKRMNVVRWNANNARRAYQDDIILLERRWAADIGFAIRQDRQLAEHARKRAHQRVAAERAAAERAAAEGAIARAKRIRDLQSEAAAQLAFNADWMTTTQHRILHELHNRREMTDGDVRQLERVLAGLGAGVA